MKIAIIGAGAMGSLFGGLLSKENEVYLIDIWEEHVNKINESGLMISSDESDEVVRPLALKSSKNLKSVDLIVLFVKSIHTLSALEENKALLGDKTLLLSLQNGYGNTDDMLKYAAKDRVLAGTTSHGANIKEAGHIFHAGKGPTYIGAMGKDQSNAIIVAKVLEKAGFELIESENIMELIWDKLFINAAINSITALLNVQNGFISTNENAKDLAKKIVYESVNIANADGMNFDEQEVFDKVMNVAKNTSSNRSSMLADVSNKRKTEIERINGAVLKKASELNLEAPYNKALTNLVLAKEDTYL